MRHPTRRLRSWSAALATAALLSAGAAGAAAPGAAYRLAGPGGGGSAAGRARVTAPRADRVSARVRQAVEAVLRGAITSSDRLVHVDESARVQAYLHVRAFGAAEAQALTDAGARVEVVNRSLGLVQAWIPAERLDAIAGLDFVTRVRAPDYGVARVGTRTTQGDSILHGDQLRALGFDGAGAKVGVISDGANNRAAAALLGDLPLDVTVFGACIPAIEQSTCNEGTAMLEIVHDLAPGAALGFCAGVTSLQFIQCVTDLKDRFGADVIVDDLLFFNEPFFEDGPVAQALDDAASAGVVAVSAAGNEGSADQSAHYQGDFVGVTGLIEDGSGEPVAVHDFGAASGGASEPTMRVTVEAGGSVTAVLQWGDPFGGAANDYDLLLLDDGESRIVASSATQQTGTDDPLESLSYTNHDFAPAHVRVAVAKANGAPRPVQLLLNGDLTVERFAVPAGSVVGHPAAANVLAVGAIAANDPGNDTIEPFSSLGPTTVLFPTAEMRAKPDLAAIDGVEVTGVGGFGSPFFGTSAAAPHVAGIAALLAGGFPDSTPAQVRASLTASAVDLGAAGRDPVFGAGRVDAIAAARRLDVPPDGTITAPAAAVTIAPGAAVSFAGSCTSPTATTSLAPRWTFGGAIPDSTLAETGPVTFADAGHYTVRLTCTDGLGKADPSPAQVQVNVSRPHSGGGGGCAVEPAGEPGGLASALGAAALLAVGRRRRGTRPGP